MAQMYQVKRHSRSEFVPIRNLTYHVRLWGTPVPGVAPLVMVHGWMDVAASYQFMVDALSHDHGLVALGGKRRLQGVDLLDRGQ